MSALPPCPQCQSTYTYDDGSQYVCPECGYEWSKDAEVSGAEQQRVIFAALRITGLTRAHQFNLVAARAQAIAQAAKGIGHPVDLWREGFGNQSDVKRSCRHDPQCRCGLCRRCVIQMMDL